MTEPIRVRAVAVLMILTVAIGLWMPVHAETAVQRALRDRRQTVLDTRAFRKAVNPRMAILEARIAHDRAILNRRAAPATHADRWTVVRKAAWRALQDATGRLRGLQGWERRRLAALQDAHDRLNGWLDTAGVFRVCPVPAFTTIANNFGSTVRLPDVPVHRHMGDDISAPTWSPILAPFDGYAWSSSSELGGLEVRVRGASGYVYNAHLSSVGSLGYVHAGQVVGYVGVTGDATGPHDHLEWHPWNGPAVDPFPYLVAACVQV